MRFPQWNTFSTIFRELSYRVGIVYTIHAHRHGPVNPDDRASHTLRANTSTSFTNIQTNGPDFAAFDKSIRSFTLKLICILIWRVLGPSVWIATTMVYIVVQKSYSTMHKNNTFVDNSRERKINPERYCGRDNIFKHPALHDWRVLLIGAWSVCICCMLIGYDWWIKINLQELTCCEHNSTFDVTFANE